VVCRKVNEDSRLNVSMTRLNGFASWTNETSSTGRRRALIMSGD
jgi:hypothetical protein